MKPDGASLRTVLYYLSLVLWAASFLGYLVFALTVNEKLKGVIPDLERGALVGLSILGVYYLLIKSSDWAMAKLKAGSRLQNSGPDAPV